MQTTTVKLYSLGYGDVRTYLFAALFVLGNMALPQLCHLMYYGGMTWLPIYMFTLIGAYKYGWRVGIITAILSPLANNIVLGMPNVSMLPSILIKSLLLAGVAGYASYRLKRVSLIVMTGIVLFYQSVGAVCEWMITGSISCALQDFRIGIPGMLLQIIGGWTFIRYVLKR